MPSPETLCLLGGDFSLEIEGADGQGNRGSGFALPHADGTGLFWFFGPENLEVAVKLVDGTALNGHVWFFAASLSNVEYTVRVVDHRTSTERTFFHPFGTLTGFADTEAFASL